MKNHVTAVLAAGFLSLTLQAQQTYKKINSLEIIKHAVELSDDKKYDEAIAEYKRVPRNDSNYVLASIELVNTYLAADKDTLALGLCNQLLKQKNDYTPNALLFKANALDNLKRPEEAEAIYLTGSKDYPTNNSFQYELGILKFKQKKYMEAYNAFIRSAQINPAHAGTHLQLGSLALQQGKIVSGMLAIQYYFVCDHTSKRALSLVSGLESIAKMESQGDSLITIPEIAEQGTFTELESILKSKMALSPKYKVKCDLTQFDLVKQMSLIVENVGKYPEEKGFYNEFYGRFFAAVWKEKHFAPYAYFALSGVENAEIQKVVTKNTKDIDAFKTWAFNYICTNLAVYPENLNGTMTTVPHWFSNNKIVAAGARNAKGLDEGYWKFFYEGGIVKAEGTFKADKKEGPWKYYFQTGDIREETTYENGEPVRVKYYYYNNNPKSEFSVKKGSSDGDVTTYYTNGKIHQQFSLSNGKKNGSEKMYHRNGIMQYDVTVVNDILQGKLEKRFDDGRLSEQVNFVNDRREGPAKEFYDDEKGSLYCEGNYKEGKRIGPWKYYHKNGKVYDEGAFNNDGQRDGLWKQYYETGVLVSESNYNNGKQDGLCKNYNEDGSLWEEQVYRKGKFMEYRCYKPGGEVITNVKMNGKNFSLTLYYSNGLKRSSGAVSDGDMTGVWKYYNKYEVLEKEATYEEGRLNGKYTKYFVNGQPSSETYYKSGVENAYYKAYHINGKLKREGWLVDDQAQGDWKSYYIDGTLASVSFYRDGEQEGWSEYYDQKGRLSSEDFYQLGCITQVLTYDTLGQVTNNVKLPGGNGTLDYKFKNGKTRFHKTFTGDYIDGESTSYFPNGQLMQVSTYKNGKETGVEKNYHYNGRLAREGNYFNGDLEGKRTSYFENGTKASEFNYVQDKRSDIGYYFHTNGKVSHETNYANDEPHGTSTLYDASGELIYQRQFDDGLLLGYTYKDASGKLLPLKKLQPGESKIVCYFQNGKKSFEVTMFNGELHGKRLIYHSNGKLIVEENFVYGESDGEHKEYYPNGNPYLVQHYVHGEENGVFKTYYENGKLQAENNYLSGYLNGPQNYYDESGKLVYSAFYNNGVPLD